MRINKQQRVKFISNCRKDQNITVLFVYKAILKYWYDVTTDQTPDLSLYRGLATQARRVITALLLPLILDHFTDQKFLFSFNKIIK